MKKTGLLFIVFLFLITAGCSGGVMGIKWMPTPGKPAAPPNNGEILFFWRSGGTPTVLTGRPYIHLGRVSGRSTWCGFVAPIDNEELHEALKVEAAQRGGDVVVMECGYGGFQCRCYGDVYRFTD